MQDFFEQDEFYRRKERVRAAEERNAKLALLEAEAARQRKIRADRLTERANVSFLRYQYERAGLSPPFVDLDGNPTVSLELLLDMGWRIEQVGNANTLVRPLHDIKPRKSRADYDQNT